MLATTSTPHPSAQDVELTPIVDERPLIDGRDGLVVLGRSVSHDGTLLLLTSPDRPPTARYVVLKITPPSRAGDEPSVERVDVKTPVRTLHFVQVLGDDLILVSGRARRWRTGESETNALLVGADGKVKREMSLGDGIEDVQATAARELWISYFDEGVMGALSGGPDTLGATGLERLDENGERIAAFDPPGGAGSVCDCYALNVLSSHETWVAYHPNFPLVQIKDGALPTSWSGAPRGSHGFAVLGRQVLFQGGYGQEDHYVLTTLETERVTERALYRFTDPSGQGLVHCQAISRGPVLWLADGSRWFRIDLRDPPWGR